MSQVSIVRATYEDTLDKSFHAPQGGKKFAGLGKRVLVGGANY